MSLSLADIFQSSLEEEEGDAEGKRVSYIRQAFFQERRVYGALISRVTNRWLRVHMVRNAFSKAQSQQLV